MDGQEFYGDMTRRLIDFMRELPGVDAGSVERVNMHTVAASTADGRIEIAVQHAAADPAAARVRGPR